MRRVCTSVSPAENASSLINGAALKERKEIINHGLGERKRERERERKRSADHAGENDNVCACVRERTHMLLIPANDNLMNKKGGRKGRKISDECGGGESKREREREVFPRE